MTFAESDIRTEPGHFCRDWQSCDYVTAEGVHLFHERMYHTRIFGKGGFLSRLLDAKTQAERDAIASEPDKVSCWMPGGGTRAEIEALAVKHGGKALPEFYAPEGADAYFLAFNDTDKARR